jgi:hypothetical protein
MNIQNRLALTRVVYIARFIYYCDPQINHLCKLRLVNSSWNDAITGHCSETWKANLEERHVILLARRNIPRIIAYVYFRRDINFTLAIKCAVSDPNKQELASELIENTLKNTTARFLNGGDYVTLVSYILENATFSVFVVLFKVGFPYKDMPTVIFKALAKNKNAVPIASYLFKRDLKPHTQDIINIISANAVDLLQYYVSVGYNLVDMENQFPSQERGLISIAITQNVSFQMISYLVSLGLSPLTNRNNTYSPLEFAAKSNRLDLVDLFLGLVPSMAKQIDFAIVVLDNDSFKDVRHNVFNFVISPGQVEDFLVERVANEPDLREKVHRWHAYGRLLGIRPSLTRRLTALLPEEVIHQHPITNDGIDKTRTQPNCVVC